LGQGVALLVRRAAPDRHIVPQAGECRLEAIDRGAVDPVAQRGAPKGAPGPPSTITSWGLAMRRAARSSRMARRAASLSPPIFLIASTTFRPSRRTPSAIGSEIAVALLSSRALTTVPSRISRTMPSPVGSRFCQASQAERVRRH
jgi:hypothetical protein